MMSTKIAQNIHIICFQVIWMTFIGDLIINFIMFEPPYVKLFFVNLTHSQAV